MYIIFDFSLFSVSFTLTCTNGLTISRVFCRHLPTKQQTNII